MGFGDKRHDTVTARLFALAGSEHSAGVLRLLRSRLRIEHLSNLQLEVAQLVRSSPANALSLAAVAWQVARLLKGAHARAIARRAQAEAHFFSGKLHRALRFYDQSIAAYREAGEKEEMARTMVGRMSLLALLGRGDEALGDARLIRPILTRADDRTYLAKYHMNRGNLHVARDDYRHALKEYNLARELFLMEGVSDAAVVGLDQNRAAVLTYMDQFEEALVTYGEAKSAAHDLGYLALEAQITHNIGHLHVLSSRHHEALRYLGEARDTFEKIPDPVQVAKCDLNRSDVYLRLHLAEEAATIADSAAQVFLENRLRYDGGLSLVIAGRALSELGRNAEALTRFRRARRLFEGEDLPIRAGLASLRTAEHEGRRGRIQAARLSFQHASKLLRGSTVTSIEMLRLQIHASIELRAGRPERALSELRNAMKLERQIGDPWLRFQGRLLMGRAYADTGAGRRGVAAFESAAKIAERMRMELGSDELRVSFSGTQAGLYDELLQLVLQSGRSPRVRRVFEIAERGRSRSLLDQLLATGSNSYSNSRLSRQETRLSWFRNRFQEESLRQEGADRSRLARIKKGIRSCERKIIEERRVVAERSGAGLKTIDPDSFDVMRAALPRAETLVEYVIVGTKIYALLVTRDTKRLVTLDASSETIENLLRQFAAQIDHFALPDRFLERRIDYLTESALRITRALYDHLWRPIDNEIKTRSVLVVPHRFLHALPFHALDDGRLPVGERYRIRYAPSATIDRLCRNRRIRGNRGKPFLLGLEGGGLASVKRETEAVAGIVGNDVISMTSTTVRDFIDTCSESPLIHLATHGRFRADNPSFSSLALGAEDLHLYQLSDARLNSELVTLSACRTGSSFVRKGDELIGLARGFMLAGATSLVVSLWRVRDEVTADWMSQFYGSLRDGRTKPEAAGIAAKEIRKKHPHPYFWAPFQVMGSPKPLRFLKRRKTGNP